MCIRDRIGNGVIRVSWTPRPNDLADRYAVFRSRNGLSYNWRVTSDNGRSRSVLVRETLAGQHRYRVRTVAANGRFVQRDCGPAGGVRIGNPRPMVASSPLRIMPIGDSITYGSSQRPGYRYPLQDIARQRNCSIDLVGSAVRFWADGPPTGRYANYDHHHQSRGGRTVGQATNNALPAVRNLRPDAVFIHLGTNDITKGVPLARSESELRRLVRGIRATRANTAIYVAAIPPPGPAHRAAANNWNNRVRSVVTSFQRQGAQIRLVDMARGWNHRTMTTDNIHPNAVGANRLATRFTDALQATNRCR